MILSGISLSKIKNITRVSVKVIYVNEMCLGTSEAIGWSSGLVTVFEPGLNAKLRECLDHKSAHCLDSCSYSLACQMQPIEAAYAQLQPIERRQLQLINKIWKLETRDRQASFCHVQHTWSFERGHSAGGSWTAQRQQHHRVPQACLVVVIYIQWGQQHRAERPRRDVTGDAIRYNADGRTTNLFSDWSFHPIGMSRPGRRHDPWRPLWHQRL